MIRLLAALVASLMLTIVAAHGQGAERPTAPQRVAVGFMPLTVSSISLADSSYYLDGYLWFRWWGGVDPTESYEIVNTIDKWTFMQERIFDQPQRLYDGSFYQALRIAGRFYQNFDLSSFPLDSQRLTLKIEDTQHVEGELVYFPDYENSRVAGAVESASWSLTGWSAQVVSHDYGTTFGWPGDVQVYSQIAFSIEITRPIRFFMWKLLLPLLVIVAATLSSSLLHPGSDIRVSVPVLSLLATVVLQQAYSNMLPEVGYLVLMDQIYVLAFAAIIATVLRGIAAVSAFKHHGAAKGGDALALRLRRTDGWFAASVSCFFVVGLGLVILLN